MKFTNKEIYKGLAVCTNNFHDLTVALEAHLENKKRLRIVTINPEMLVAADQNQEFFKAVKAADLVIPDGMGIVLLLKKKGAKDATRVPGIELSWKALELAIQQNLPIAIIGSTDSALEGSLKTITEKLGKPNLIYSHNGFFDEKEKLQIQNVLFETKPALVLVAMPFIKQEIFLAELFEKGLNAIAFGVGGSLDVWSGKVERAPLTFQRLGLEWLWRVLGQPERFSRLLKTLLPFVRIYFS
ncbi:MAG: WecB/TagA/CpsF family glycosyltransferase [Candidatus Caenarcaniphilales bacterium]|nr:WecB/TagA/CpsF family glycosyltransferase [Candidatus Caenarcaniphilales bacterium]